MSWPGPGVANRQFAAAPPTADKTGKQGIAMLGRSVMPARRHIVADHLADRLRPLPTDVTFMGFRDQRQPFLARLAAAT